MANTLGLDFAADADEMSADIPSTLAWGSQSIIGTGGAISQEIDVTDEYDYTPNDRQWQGRVSDFTGSTLPALQTVVTVDSVKYHVANINKGEDGDVVVFALRRL